MKLNKSLSSVFAAAVLALSLPSFAGAEDKALPPSEPKMPISDPFPRTIIAAKEKSKPGLQDRRLSPAKAMLGNASELYAGWQNTPNAGSAAWSENLVESFNKAVSEHKALLVYFYFPGGENNDKMSKVVDALPRLDQVAKCAVLARVNIYNDDSAHNVSNMTKDLGYNEFPELTLMVPTSKLIQSIGSVHGYLESDETQRQLEVIFKNLFREKNVPQEVADTFEPCRNLYPVR